jgi:hypothetical protein
MLGSDARGAAVVEEGLTRQLQVPSYNRERRGRRFVTSGS